jgi:putative protease
MSRIELLAPAKDLECGKSAIKCGADAVYIGAPAFGARKAAGNSLEDIKKLIDFAHQYYAKVYVTINTLLDNEEIKEAKKLIEELYVLEVDAIIIQDTGLLEIDLPPVPIIASTQMHNITLEKIQFLEAVGFKRVILARELSLDQIREIGEKTKIELEGFIHGALCVCYSGQCYLSYAIGGRSGNRGDCAQPCRKSYTLIDNEGNLLAENQCLLSLKDLNLSENIEDLIQAGLTSFKIEGRLKDENYIKNVVSYYRKEIDQVLEKIEMKKASSGKSLINFTPDLNKTFNRGYTTYFLKNRLNDIHTPHTPKAIGESVGVVKDLDKTSFTMTADKELAPGDGICFFDIHFNLHGTNVNQVIGNKIYPNDMKGINKGTEIYRNYDISFLKELKNAKIERLISVEFALSLQGNDLALSVVDEDGIEAQETIEIDKEPAQNVEMVMSNLQKNLSKLGGTEFFLTNLDIKLTDVYFIPVSQINDLRRRTLESLKLNRERNRIREFIKIVPNDSPYPQKEVDFSTNVLNDYARQFYKRHGVEKIDMGAEAINDMKGKKVMTTKHCLKYQHGYCPKEGSNEELKEPLFLIDEYNKKYELMFDCTNCEMEIYF